ncbi:3-hydroxyacyl-CoA dehydrogenase [Metallosphaera hakonensis]|uniref:3-hydroxybutyryl-CoA dehydrogenase n=1 Tax=Metallosphaera hakonensis JCM 8857 = DSM 7519 TaxID=1293036 RepID=A0A2U9ISQ9_9CREN|nr:3-hydroxyacyl-CoA dehydrogenase [Metallosphaera hakonensis]AWR99054.1 3-hydroxyacyl-CoA dehydrogenase family protein [Metallosphaera hakonensis JCM 8857 = DSM 7519]
MKVFVVGSGVMGSGIGQVFAMAGNEVKLYDVREDALKKAMDNIRWSVQKLHEKGSVRDPDSVMSRISTSVDLNEAKDHMVIEAVFEDLKVKGEVLSKVSTITHEIIASNTSSLPITDLSKFVKNAERFLGMHFFNPPVLMKLVEVIRGDLTSDQTFYKALDIVKSLGKFPLPVRKDVFGFVVNRVLFRMFTSACNLLELYTPEEIDSVAMKELGMPMGLIMLLDYTGIDVNYDISKEAERRGFPFRCEVLERMVRSGKLGRKTGQGFYDWSKGKPEIKGQRGPDPKELIRGAVDEARWLISQGVVTREELETGVKLGLGMTKGVLELADTFGI